MSNGRFRKKENKFTQISNDALSDTTLSTKALGLYCRINYYLSIPDWDLYKNHLMRVCPEGEDAFETMWKELKSFGYLIQHKMQDEKGKIYWEYELSDDSIHTPKNHPMDKPEVEKPPHGKPPLYNNTKTNNTLPSNTKHTQEKELCAEIETKLGEKISQKKIKELINSKGADAVNQYLSNWDKYRHHANSTQASYFIYAVQNELPIPQAKKSTYNKPTHENFDQREYSEEELEKYYVDVTQ